MEILITDERMLKIKSSPIKRLVAIAIGGDRIAIIKAVASYSARLETGWNEYKYYRCRFALVVRERIIDNVIFYLASRHFTSCHAFSLVKL